MFKRTPEMPEDYEDAPPPEPRRLDLTAPGTGDAIARILADHGLIYTTSWIRVAEQYSFFENVARQCALEEVADALVSSVALVNLYGIALDTPELIEDALALAARSQAAVRDEIAWTWFPSVFPSREAALVAIRDRVLSGHVPRQDEDRFAAVYFVLRDGEDEYAVTTTPVQELDHPAFLARLRAHSFYALPEAAVAACGDPTAWWLGVEEAEGFEREIRITPRGPTSRAGGMQWKIAEQVGPLMVPLLPEHFMHQQGERLSSLPPLWGERCATARAK